MRNNETDVRRCDLRTCEGFFRRLTHALHGAFENFLAVEVPLGISELQCVVAVNRAHAADAQRVTRIRITTQFFRDHAERFFARLEYDGRGSIAEQYGD